MRLVGREEELGTLHRAITSASGGHGRFVVVHGPAGSGKSALLSTLATQAADRGSTVLVGRCREAVGAVPYWPWMEAIAGRARQLSEDQRLEELGPGAPHLLRAMPDLAAAISGVGPSELSSQFMVFQSIAAWLERLSSSGPALLILDDLHAADTASLQVLDFVIDQLRDVEVAVVGAYRSEDGAAAPELMRVVRHGAAHVAVGPLDRSAVAALAEDMLGESADVEFVDELVSCSEGHPLAVVEYLHAGDLRRVPPPLATIMLERIGDLQPRGVDVVDAAAVLGRTFRPRDVASMLELSIDAVLGHLETLLQRGVLASDDSSALFFRHGLFVDVVRQRMTLERRESLHLSAARTLESTSAPVVEIAYHHCQAAHLGSPDRAVAALREAGAMSIERFAFDEAVRHARTALAIFDHQSAADQTELLIELSRALWLSGAVAEADATAWAAIEAATSASDRAAAALCVGGGIVTGTPHDAKIEQVVTSLLHTLPDARTALAARVLARQAQLRSVRVVTAELVSDALRAVDLSEEIGDDADRAYCLFMAHFALDDPLLADRRSGLSDRFLEVAQRLRDPEVLIHALQFRAVDLLQSERFADLPAILDRHDSLAATLQQPLYIASGHLTRAAVAIAQERPAVADQHALVALEALDSFPGTQFRLWALIARVEAARQLARATPDLRQQVEALLTEEPNPPAIALALAATLAAAEGDLDRARELYEPFARSRFSSIEGMAKPVSLSLFAEAAVALEDRDSAHTLHEVLDPYRDRLITASRPPIAPRKHGEHYLTMLAAIASDPPGDGDRTATIVDQGDHLVVTYAGRTVSTAAAKGLRHVIRLLASPGQEVHVAELAGARADLNGLGPLLDSEAKAAFRRRLEEIEHDLDEADGHHDLGRSAELARERDLLIDELTSAAGLAGRDRNPASSVERARSAVTQAIRRSIRRLQAPHPELAAHLDRTIQTGTYCVYRPDPRNAPEWNITTQTKWDR